MNKKGFISMSLIYSFFIVFITILLALLSLYVTNRGLLNRIKNEIKDDLIIVQLPEENGTNTIEDGDIRVDYDTNMIPVAYTTLGQTVKADITNADPNYKWFDYSEKRWANAVLVTDATRKTYKNATPGTPISENDILGYVVYVPRYRYQLFNAHNAKVSPRSIEIEFENKTTPKSNGTTNGTWLTHPAFTFGTTELNGIWVGKFETSPEESSSCYVASNETNCNITYLTPRIKANKNSWRYVDASKMFTVSQYLKSNSIYGINKSTIDSHIMKNMEWGAVAYLSHSEYGKNSEVNMNNYALVSSYNDTTLTGCSSGFTTVKRATTCSYPYPSMGTAGEGASTTGTIYGIYDMNAGANEYVMGVMEANGGGFNPQSSGFAYTWGATNTKYYDTYTHIPIGMSEALAFRNGKLGDATREILTYTNANVEDGNGTCGWYDDASNFPYALAAWFYRGGLIGTIGNMGPRTGIFYFSSSGGGATDTISWRITLAVE